MNDSYDLPVPDQGADESSPTSQLNDPGELIKVYCLDGFMRIGNCAVYTPALRFIDPAAGILLVETGGKLDTIHLGKHAEAVLRYLVEHSPTPQEMAEHTLRVLRMQRMAAQQQARGSERPS